MQRGVTVEQVRSAVRLAQKYGIKVGMFLMWGYEGEELEDIAATVEHVKLTNPDVFFTTVSYPIKGTPYFDTVSDRLELPLAWADASDRDYVIAGRRGKDYYRLADLWLRSEVDAHRARPCDPERAAQPVRHGDEAPEMELSRLHSQTPRLDSGSSACPASTGIVHEPRRFLCRLSVAWKLHYARRPSSLRTNLPARERKRRSGASSSGAWPRQLQRCKEYRRCCRKRCSGRARTTGRLSGGAEDTDTPRRANASQSCLSQIDMQARRRGRRHGRAERGRIAGNRPLPARHAADGRRGSAHRPCRCRCSGSTVGRARVRRVV